MFKRYLFHLQVIKPPHTTALDKCRSLMGEIDIQDIQRQVVQKGMGTYDSTDDLVDAMIDLPCNEQYFSNFLHILEQIPKYTRRAKALRDEWDLIKARQDMRHNPQQQDHQESEAIEISCPVQETTQSACTEIPAEVLKYVNKFIPSSATTVPEISQIAEEYADRETLLFIAKHITETLQIYCVAFREWFLQEAMDADTDEAEFQLLNIVRKLKKLKDVLSKNPSVYNIKTCVIKELLIHMRTVTKVRKFASSSFGLAKLWAFKVVIEKLTDMVKKLSEVDDLHYDQALKFLEDYYNEQNNGIKEEIARNEKQNSVMGVLAGGAVGCGMGLMVGCATLSAGAACTCSGGIIVGSILLCAGIGYIGGKLYLIYSKKTGTKFGKALLSNHKN